MTERIDFHYPRRSAMQLALSDPTSEASPQCDADIASAEVNDPFAMKHLSCKTISSSSGMVSVAPVHTERTEWQTYGIGGFRFSFDGGRSEALDPGLLALHRSLDSYLSMLPLEVLTLAVNFNRSTHSSS